MPVFNAISHSATISRCPGCYRAASGHICEPVPAANRARVVNCGRAVVKRSSIAGRLGKELAMSNESSEMYDFQYLPPPERRLQPRASLRVQARILVDGEAIEADTTDLSAHGVAVTSTHPLNIDQECSIELGI